MRTELSLLLAGLSSLLVLACSNSDRNAGGVTEGGNTSGIVAGQLYLPNGSPAARVRMIVRPDTFVTAPTPALTKVSTLDSTTDSLGRYQLEMLPGSYVAEFADAAGQFALIRFQVSDSAARLDLPTDTLGPAALLRGKVATTVLDSVAVRYVQVLGMERLVEIDADGNFEFDDLPAGAYVLRLVTEDGVKSLTLSTPEMEEGDDLDLGELYETDLEEEEEESQVEDSLESTTQDS